MKIFWEKLKKEKQPFFCLAPMADVTDVAFRQIVVRYGKPDIIWTEMVSCDGLCSVGKEKLLKILEFAKNERPIVAQVFGSNPDNFYQSAKLIKELGFDGIDINMGCPQKNILKQGAGSALIKTPQLAQEIIKATQRGAGKLPVSIKTRIGFNKNEIETWLPILLEAKPTAITLHGRTKKEMSKVPAHWDIIKRGVEIAKNSGVVMIGNGAVQNIEDGLSKAKASGVDGVMLGRAVLSQPWLFSKNLGVAPLSNEKKIEMLKEHLKLFEKYFGENKRNKKIYGGRAKSFALMKKYFKTYLSDFRGAKELRIELMNCANEQKALKLLERNS